MGYDHRLIQNALSDRLIPHELQRAGAPASQSAIDPRGTKVTALARDLELHGSRQ